MSKLFEKIGEPEGDDNIPLKCYELLSSKSCAKQKQLYRILTEIDKYEKS